MKTSFYCSSCDMSFNNEQLLLYWKREDTISMCINCNGPLTGQMDLRRFE